MPKPLSLSILCLCMLVSAFCPRPVAPAEVNCHDGSSINGIDGFDIRVFCNPLAEKIMVHRTLIEDFARRYMSASGLEMTGEINPESGMVGISLTSVEWIVDGIPRGYATSLNLDLNRAALCLLGDGEFHAISSIVWQEDRLIVSDRERSRDCILEILRGSLDRLIEDLANADPSRYRASSSPENVLADSGD